jgi:hypothetical protein
MTSWMSLKSLPPLRWDEPYPQFGRVSLETTGRCTRRCVFCPMHDNTSKKLNQMPQAMFDAVVDQLVAMSFVGAVHMMNSNEPLTDPDIVSRVARVREALPRACIIMVSNGDLLRDHEHVAELFQAGLNALNVDCYDARAYARVRGISQETLQHDATISCESSISWGKLSARARVFSVVDASDVMKLYPLGMHSWVDPKVEARLRALGMLRRKWPKFCARPHRHLVVRHDGSVPLCCVISSMIDAEPVGDWRDLLGAWNSGRMQRYRWLLQQGRREGQCTGCQAWMAFPHVVRRVEDPR